jgi:hypothetical protein
MSKKQPNDDLPIEGLTNESARQRWELFHRAIAHAKESNNAVQDDGEIDTADTADTESAGPLLTIVR